MCNTVLEKEDLAVYICGSVRFWQKKSGDKDTKLLNPLIALNRDEKIISKIFQENAIEFPNVTFDVEIIDKRSYDNRFPSLSKYSTPMKLCQFKATQAILAVRQTTAISRLFGSEEIEAEEENDGN